MIYESFSVIGKAEMSYENLSQLEMNEKFGNVQ